MTNKPVKDLNGNYVTEAEWRAQKAIDAAEDARRDAEKPKPRKHYFYTYLDGTRKS